MSGIAEFWRRVLGRARRREMEERLAEEMDFHVEMKRREYVESGMAEEEAKAAARREIGSVARVVEDSREAWGFARAEALWQDARYAWRTLRRSPGFVLAAVVGSGLAVGAVTAVFSVVDAALLRPLPYREPERLVVWDQLRALGFTRFPVSIPNFLDYRQARVFEQAEAWGPGSVTVRMGERSQRLEAGRATAGLLSLLGDRAAQGRWFVAEENIPGRGAVAVLSDAAWRRWFGGDPAIPGRRILIDEEPHEVVGVLPGSFRFLPAGSPEPEVWLPLAVVNDANRNRAALRVIARLADRVTVEQAASRMRELGRRLMRDYRVGMGPNGEDGGFSSSVTPLRQELYGAARPALYAVGGATLVLLCMGCCNTAFLWLTRVSGRREELALREALGAGVARLAQHRIVEGVLVAVGSAVVGLAMAAVAVRALQGAQIGELPVLGAVRLDWRVLVFTTLVSGAIGVLCSVLPVWRVRRGGEWSNRSGTAGVGESRTRSGLIVAQAALTCALLAAALLLGRSFVKLLEVDPGFRPAGLMTAQVSLPPRYGEPAQVSGYYQRLIDQMETRLGAGAATLTSRLPLSFGPGGDPFSIEGWPYQANGPTPQMTHAQAVAGLFLTAADTRCSGAGVRGTGLCRRGLGRCSQMDGPTPWRAW